MNIIDTIQDNFNENFDVLLTRRQVTLMIISCVAAIVFVIFLFSIDRVPVDSVDMSITPPDTQAPLFEKK